MATTSYTIYSHYDPEDREVLEIETGQAPSSSTLDNIEDTAKIWEAEASTAFKRRIAPAPRFVPATIPDGEWNITRQLSAVTAPTRQYEIGSWYKSLQRSVSSTPLPAPTLVPERPQPPCRNTCTENDMWFIQNAIRSEPASSSTYASTLADILDREPPPLPSEPKFKPPVFLAIGPSNRGFNMLEKRGWNEGEALGPDVIRRKRVLDIKSTRSKGKRRAVEPTVREEFVELSVGSDDDVKEVRKVSVVDLTLSDSETDSDWSSGLVSALNDSHETEQPSVAPFFSDRKALITPLPTVLKSDRLGIGLKAKTVGPYKESKKRVTHNVAALAAHHEANEDLQKRKRKFGKGKRGLAREYEQDQMSRQALLAYMNE